MGAHRETFSTFIICSPINCICIYNVSDLYPSYCGKIPIYPSTISLVIYLSLAKSTQPDCMITSPFTYRYFYPRCHSKFFSFLKALVNRPSSMLLLTPKHKQAPPHIMNPRVDGPFSSHFVQVVQVYSCLVVDL